MGATTGWRSKTRSGDATLFEEHVPLGGAVLEAAYAATDPPVARRLRSEHVPLILDMHSLRFTGEGFLAVERIAKLPYAPDAPLDPAEITEASARALAAGTAFFAQEALAATYTVPGLPLNDKPLEACLTANRRLTEAACALNGAAEIERKPVIAMVAPGRKGMASPELVLDWLVDLPVTAIYLQPLNFQPTRDSTEKLADYLAYIQACQEVSLPVYAGVLGPSGWSCRPYWGRPRSTPDSAMPKGSRSAHSRAGQGRQGTTNRAEAETGVSTLSR